MPEQLFAIKSKNLINLQRFFKRSGPRQFNRAAAMTLTSFAFGTSRKSRLIIKNRMTVRNERFVNSAIRTEKARQSAPMISQVATSGSIERPRFTGWAEQELGKKTDRTRTASLFARGGGSKALRPSFRMKPGNSFTSPNDFEGKDDQHRATIMLQSLSRERKRKPFIIKGHRKFKAGLYKFKGKKIKRIQSFQTTKQPKRIKWLTLARQLYFRTTSVDGVWAESLRRVLKFR